MQSLAFVFRCAFSGPVFLVLHFPVVHFGSIDQPTNQPTNQTNKQTNKQAIKQSINQSIKNVDFKAQKM